MFRFLVGSAALAAAVPAVELGGYDKHSSDSKDGGYGKHHYGKHHKRHHSDVHFPKAYAVIDPDYYNTVFTGYQKCVSTKCDSLPNAYSATGLSDCISTVAGYTSCVTACAGAQLFESVEDFRTLLDDVIVIGHDQLRKARLYLSGLGDLDVVGERVHIGDSCCLPNSYFAAWERILVPVEIPHLKVDEDSDDGYKRKHKHKKGKKGKKSRKRGEYLLGEDGDELEEGTGKDEGDVEGEGEHGEPEDGETPDENEQNETKPDIEGGKAEEPKKDAGVTVEEKPAEEAKDSKVVDKDGPKEDEIKVDHPPAKYMISAADYVKQCLPCESTNNKVDWLNHITCDAKLAEYLQFLQRNLGHLILAPTCEDNAPDGGCCGDDLKPYNPRAVKFHDDVCVATKSEKHGKHKTLTNPLVKPVDHDNYHDPCPCDTLELGGTDGEHETIKYKRVKHRDLLYYSVATGLPSAVSITDHVVSCSYDLGLVRDDDGDSYDERDFFSPAPPPADWEKALEAVRACPTDGLLEYCNVDQYATYLEYQLFDHANCDISELRLQDTDVPATYKTIACLYKIFSLKCDCMEAVLNCYALTPTFATALSKVIGQAASILCGFILCQRPSIYALFGEEYAINHATLFRELLAAAGVMDGAAVTPAITVFAAFALGMVALFATQKARAVKDKVDVDDGYQNLI